MRQAVAYCINREALVKSLFNGAATVANDHSFAPVYVDTQIANSEIPQRKQDYEKAKALLKEAGVNGVEITLTTGQYLEMPQYAVALREYCKPAGININVNVMPTDQYYGSGDNQPWLVVPMGETDWAARGTVAQAIIPEFPTGALWNAAHWSDAQFDKLFADYNAELDHQKRQKLALEIAKIEHEELPGHNQLLDRRAAGDDKGGERFPDGARQLHRSAGNLAVVVGEAFGEDSTGARAAWVGSWSSVLP